MHAHCCFIGCSSLRERNAKSLESDRRKKVASGNSLRKRRRRRSACSPSSPNYNLLIYIPANCTFPRATFPAVIFALINRTRRSFLRDRQMFLVSIQVAIAVRWLLLDGWMDSLSFSFDDRSYRFTSPRIGHGHRIPSSFSRNSTPPRVDSGR